MGAGFQLSFTVLGVTLAIAVLRYRLFDIDLVINRTLVYAVLTSGVIGVYVLVVGYLGWLFQNQGNLTLALIATGLIAVGFAPARQLVQRGVNRLLYGERDEPYWCSRGSASSLRRLRRLRWCWRRPRRRWPAR